MAKFCKIVALVALAGVVSACDQGTDLQRAGVGGLAGGGIAAATHGNVVEGAAIGAAAGALSDDVARALDR